MTKTLSRTRTKIVEFGTPEVRATFNLRNRGVKIVPIPALPSDEDREWVDLQFSVAEDDDFEAEMAGWDRLSDEALMMCDGDE